MTDYKNELRSVLYDFLGDYKDKRYLSEGNTDQALAAIREHFLKEALEMIGEDDYFPDPEGEDRDFVRHQVTRDYRRNELRQELRNKFNDKYKED